MDSSKEDRITMFTPKGRFAWYELMTSDTKAAGKFYSDVVGWTTKEVSSGDMQYTTFNLGEAGMAGMLTIPGHTAWIGYIAVDDVDARVKKAQSAGATLMRPIFDVPNVGRIAILREPGGAGIGWMTPPKA